MNWRGSEAEDTDEKDEREYPRQEAKLKWDELNQDLYSNPRDPKDCEMIATDNP